VSKDGSTRNSIRFQVSTHSRAQRWANILDKTGTANRTEAAVYARDHGLV
jgi:DNA-binding NarL/FixJ family response regulator